MRRATVGLLVVVVALLAGAGVYGVLQVGSGDGGLTELWVSNTARETTANHHAPTAARLDNETVVIAPVNAPQASGDCALPVFTMDLEERWRGTVHPDACNIHAFGDPIVADLDGDGNETIFVATTEKLVHAYDLRTGRQEFSRNLTGWGYTAPVVTDFTPANGQELIVADLSGGVSVFNASGDLVWRRDLSGIIAPIFVDDFDGDGTDELAVGEGRNVTLVAADGTIAQQTFVGRVLWLTVGQADDDDAIELVAATREGQVVAVDGRTGEIEWTQEYDDQASVYAFGDGDEDGQAEVYAVAGDGRLRALDASDGTFEWTTTLTTEDVRMTPPPALGDLDGDGQPELVAVSQDGLISIVDPESGEIMDSYKRDIPIWMRPTLADLTGDGSDEVLVIYGDGSVVALAYGQAD